MTQKSSILIAAGALLLSSQVRAQAPAAPPTAKAAAPIDLTGYWVSLVTEDWRFRMITPPKGDYASVPLTADARKVADAWDPAKDEAAGNQCKSYGAAAIMRVPGRLHVTWENDSTLRIDTDAGTQTRQLKFAGPRATEATLQGDSVAVLGTRRGRKGPRASHRWIAQGCDHAHEARLSAQERRTL